MVKLSLSDERVFGDIRDRLNDLQQHLTPTTEKFVPLEVLVRKLLEELSHFDPIVRLCVIGHPKSGKSSLINAIIGSELLPENTNRELQVVPFASEMPMIKRLAGKALASGEQSVKEQLLYEQHTWLAEFSDRRLHANLPLIGGQHCYAAKWVVVDTPRGTTGIIPKLSSVASRIHSPNVFVGHLMFYCVDCTLLGTEKEDSLLEELIGSNDAPQSTKQRLVHRTFFILTHIDKIIEEEEMITNVHRSQPPPITKVADVKAHFVELAKRKLEIDVEPERVFVFSSPLALLATKVVKPDASINDVYEYCERVYGSNFMQQIDTMEEDFLRRTVKRHVDTEGETKYGLKPVSDLLRLVDFNAVRHLMSYIAATSTECCEQLADAMDKARPTIGVQIAENTAEHKVLVDELEWLVDQAQEIEKGVSLFHEELVHVVNIELDRFFEDRLLELRYVLEHRELAWFRSRQACTVIEMQSSLRKLESFTREYITQRSFIENKVMTGEEGNFSFLDNNMAALLLAMEERKKEHLVHFGTCYAHHVKDEFQIFLDELLVKIQATRDVLKEKFFALCAKPIEQTTIRSGETLDLELVLEPILSKQLLEPNNRRLNNFLRDLPEHVAVAAVDISNQWYEAARSDTTSVVDGTQPPSLDASPIPQQQERSIVERGVAKQERSLSAAAAGGDESYSIDPSLRYVLEAWRLSFLALEPHQLCTYNLHDVAEAIADANEEILDFIKKFVDSLEDGIREQVRLMRSAEREATDVVAVAETARPLITKFLNLMGELDLLILGDLETARMAMQREAQEELQQP